MMPLILALVGTWKSISGTGACAQTLSGAPISPQLVGRPVAPQTVTLVLCHRQTGYYDIRVVRETQTIRPVSGFQLAAGYEQRLVISGHHRPVDGAFDIAALNRERDILNDGLALSSGLVNGVIGLAAENRSS